MNINQCLITTLWIRPLYLISGKTSQVGLGLCKCRQVRITDEILIATQGSSMCKDGGRGTVMMGLNSNRGGVMLWILNMNGVFTEGFNRCVFTYHWTSTVYAGKWRTLHSMRGNISRDCWWVGDRDCARTTGLRDAWNCTLRLWSVHRLSHHSMRGKISRCT